MFTGIIEEVGAVSRRSGPELEIMAEHILEGMKLGDSVAVDGVCLTVAALKAKSFVVQVSPETFSKSTLGRLRAGHAVNLERALAAGDRFGGHFVLGHVDGVGRIENTQTQGEFAVWRFKAPEAVACYLVPKGSIALDGISLTVVNPQKDLFEVALIPTTLAKTTLGNKGVGDKVNMEADLIGKHIHHFVFHGTRTGITPSFLAEHGF